MELGSIGVGGLMLGALGWPTPTEDMGFWRPAFGELSMAGERDRTVSPKKISYNHCKLVTLQPLQAGTVGLHHARRVNKFQVLQTSKT